MGAEAIFYDFYVVICAGICCELLDVSRDG
jgi:hypothetical protein